MAVDSKVNGQAITSTNGSAPTRPKKAKGDKASHDSKHVGHKQDSVKDEKHESTGKAEKHNQHKANLPKHDKHKTDKDTIPDHNTKTEREAHDSKAHKHDTKADHPFPNDKKKHETQIASTKDGASVTGSTHHIDHGHPEHSRKAHEADKRRADEEGEKSLGKRAKLDKSHATHPKAHSHARRPIEHKTLTDPGILGGLVSVVDLALACVLGGLAYKYWSVPRWDRRILSGLAFASVGLLSVEGWVHRRIMLTGG